MTEIVKERPPAWPPGKLADTIFIGTPDAMNYSFNLEQIDDDLFEFTIFILDKDKNRTEYSINVNSEALQVLSNGIQYCLEDANNRKRSV